ncbi:MAG: alpha/beta hydrolase [Ruminococcaceae bacterium]|nr:alpha/beta hydrolase [Oscillospiraceae bacterium]
MAVVRKDFTFLSTVGDLEIHAVSWKPEKKKIKGIFQIIHGMAEHIDRYVEFAEFMAENGYAVYGHDHIGHGDSTNCKYFWGYFGINNTNGRVFVADARELMKIAESEHPGLPIILFGHSMGSLIARHFAAIYGERLAGAIFCGTVGPNPAAGVAIKLCDIMSAIDSPMAEGKLIDKLALGTYNNRTEKRTPSDWLSRDTAVVDAFVNDPRTGFYFTNRGFRDMLSLLKFVNSNKCAKWTYFRLPILLVAGTEDPCGNYGEGVKAVARKLRFYDHIVDEIYYEGARHEILNELEKEKTMQDILEWSNRKIS